MNKYICGSYIPGENLTEQAASEIDFTKITHAFLAFSVLHENEKGMFVPFFSEGLINSIKIVKDRIDEMKADTKVLVSIGGWGAGLFCEASSTEENRLAFAAECKKLIDEYGIDGVDMDWEFPGIASDGVKACEHCQTDYIMLCDEIKKAIGDKLLTAAVGSDHWLRFDCAALNKSLDLVNVMTYDMSTFAHSSMTYTKAAVEGWANQGIDREKVVLGVPFYARCDNPDYEWRGYSDLMKLVAEGKAEKLHTEEQDYVVINGNRLSIETPESIAKKIQYIKEMNFAGIFNWQELTDKDGELRTAMAEILK